MKLHERNLARRRLRNEHPRKPHDKKSAPRKAAWDLARKIFKLKAEDKATFCSPVKRKAPVPVSKNTEERMFVVDSGASMHMLSSDEMDTLRRSRTPTTVVTANGEVQFNISICLLQCNYSKKRQQFYRLESFAQNTNVHMSVKNGETPRLTKDGKNYLYNGQLRTSCRTRIVIIFQQQLGFYIEAKGSVQFFL